MVIHDVCPAGSEVLLVNAKLLVVDLDRQFAVGGIPQAVFIRNVGQLNRHFHLKTVHSLVFAPLLERVVVRDILVDKVKVLMRSGVLLGPRPLGGWSVDNL